MSCHLNKTLRDTHKLRALPIKRGDEVITVAAGFPTTVAPMIQYGAVPVFVDVTIPQYNIDVSKLEEALSNKTKGGGATLRLLSHSVVNCTGLY